MSTPVSAHPQEVVVPSSPPPSAIDKRAHQPHLAQMWSLEALLPQLPLPWPVDPALPPSPKVRYRSQYQYPGHEALLDDSRRQAMSLFEVALHLIDFSPLERPLAQTYLPSLKGQAPFHPVSMLLAIGLRLEEKKSWRGLAKLLAGPHGEGWRHLFGFQQGQTPSPSGLRYFFQAVGPQCFASLCPQMLTLLHQHGLLPEHSTFPGDPDSLGVSMSQDGMLHEARSRPSCQQATDQCYQPLPPAPILHGTSQLPEERPVDDPSPPIPSESSTPLTPTAPSGRPCRDQTKGLTGCACDTPACQPRCHRASALDPQARLIHYEGHNDKQGKAQRQADNGQQTKGQGTKHKGRGKDVFGYRSEADRLLDDRFAVAWTAQSDLYSANTDERTVFVPRLAEQRRCLPWLKIGECLADAGLGYTNCLNAICAIGALRMVDIRTDPSDADPELCLVRGYNGDGHPLCPHGYELYSNGYDYDRHRAKWACRGRCHKEPLVAGGPVQTVQGCPYLDDPPGLGRVINVGREFPDGSARLARDIPYGSDAWNARYGRRNLSESRNAQMEGMGLKRMRSYGLERNTKEVRMADWLINLHTLGRLVTEATDLQVA